MTTANLQTLFNPKSVAIFGASTKTSSVAGIILKNMLDAKFKGDVYPVNPKYTELMGVPCYASVELLPQIPDLVVIATPAPTIAGILKECGERGVRQAVVISAGFREIGAAGLKLEQEMLAVAHKYGIRFIGPNCLGIQTPSIGLNATFALKTGLPGDLALVSQSGAVCTAMLDWANSNDIGFSKVISSGAAANVDFGEILDYLASDPTTKAVIMYIEGLRESRQFMSALRALSRVKPVVLVKVGRHSAGSKAVASHTGAMVGSDSVFDALVRRAGVVRVKTITQLFACAKALSTHIQPKGNRLAIVTNGGGPGVMATDMASDLGVPLAEFSPNTLNALNASLPPTWSHGNPIDVIGDAGADRYTAAVAACVADDSVDGVLVLLTPQAMTNPEEAATAVINVANTTDKPILTCWMGAEQVDPGKQLFKKAGVPYFTTPEPAVEAFSFLADFYQNQRQLMQVPGPLDTSKTIDVVGAKAIIENALASGRSILTEVESKAILASFHIPIAMTVIARGPTEAMLLAQQIGFPVVMKINSPNISHKSDIGGVVLNLENGSAVRAAYTHMLASIHKKQPDAILDGVVIEPMLTKRNTREVIVGITTDPVVGPVIAFGAGGVNAEATNDQAVVIPPLNRFLARDTIARTKVSKLLGNFRGQPAVNMVALEDIMLRVSDMICELPWIQELDINPVLVGPAGAVAVDARIVVKAKKPTGDKYAHMVIHPYPTNLESSWQLPDGTDVIIRPIRPEDAEMTQMFVKGLSDEAKYFRFGNVVHSLSNSMLTRLTQIDYDREMALVAVTTPNNGSKLPVELGVVRFNILSDGKTGECAMLMQDAMLGAGLLPKMLAILFDIARQKGLTNLQLDMAKENSHMLEVVANAGFGITPHPADYSLRHAVRIL